MKTFTRSFLILVLMVLAGPASAQAELLPALYKVTGVATDDVLNVREKPGASYAVLTTLGPDARGVEVVQISADGRWGLVGNGEISGWASMRYLARQSLSGGYDLPRPLYCFGTEPFWGLQLGQPESELEIFGEVQQVFLSRWDGVADGRGPNTYGLVLEHGGKTVHAVISRNICDDGMSDRLFGFEIHAILSNYQGTRMLSGCCTLAPSQMR